MEEERLIGEEKEKLVCQKYYVATISGKNYALATLRKCFYYS